MPFLKTNQRLAGNDLGPTALGGGFNNYLQGSMGGGLETSPMGGRQNRFFGGFVMFSISETNSAILSRASDSILASYYGITFVSNVLDGGAGFRVVPIAVYNVSQMATLHVYYPTYSFGTDSVIFIVANLTSMSTGPSNIILTLDGGSVAHHVAVVGLIFSTPAGPWS